MGPELFDFHLFRFSFGETKEEATRKRKSKFVEEGLFRTRQSLARFGF